MNIINLSDWSITEALMIINIIINLLTLTVAIYKYMSDRVMNTKIINYMDSKV